jgi:hypothetical protein
LQNVAVADLSEEEKTVMKSSSGNRSWKRSTEQPTNLILVHQFWEHT